MFVAVLGKTLRVLRTVVQGGQITFAQGGDARNILACRGVIFMPGKSPPCVVKLRNGKKSSHIFREEERPPVFDPKRT